MDSDGRLVCGDCAKVMEGMPEGSVDLIVTSPPYDDIRDYKGYSFDFEGTARHMLRVLKEGGVAVWVVGDRIKNGNRSLTSFRQGIAFQEAGFKMHDVMIYQKRNTPFMRSNAYTNAHEFMLVLVKGARPATFNPLMDKSKYGGTVGNKPRRGPDGVNHYRKVVRKDMRVRTNIWPYSVGGGISTPDKIAYGHPAIFPEKLAEDHILTWSNPGDMVLDPFCGSGTTLKMAQIHGRRWMGIDVSPEYIEIARRRVDIYAAQGRLTAS